MLSGHVLDHPDQFVFHFGAVHGFRKNDNHRPPGLIFRGLATPNLSDLCFNLLAANTDLRRAQIISMGLFVLGFIALANLHTANLTTAYLAVGLVGASFGAGQVGVMGMLGHYWSTRLFPMLIAIVLLVQTVGGCLVAVLAGAYFDAHQTYLPVIFAIGTVNVLAILWLWAMAPQRKQHKVEPRSTSV